MPDDQIPADADLPLEAGEIAPGAVVLVALGLAAAAWVVGRILARTRRGLPAVDLRPHPPVAWGGGDVAAAVASYLGLQLVAAAIVPTAASVHLRLAAAGTAVLAATALTAAQLRARGASRESLGLSLARLRDDAALGVGGLALVLAPLLCMAGLLDRIQPYRHEIIDFLAAHRDPLAIGLVAFCAVVTAPIAEEFLFRRVLQGWLEASAVARQPAAPILLSSAAFALAHYGHGLGWIPLFFFGLVCGYLARQTGSIVPGIVLHGLFNAVSLAIILARP